MEHPHSGEIECRIGTLKQGDHVCMVYENRAEQVAAAIPFILRGLEENECCLYVADDLTVAEVLEALSKRGVDVKREKDKGALRLFTKRDSYLRKGRFDPEEMIETLSTNTEEAVQSGFRGLRITGEMTWALGGEIGCDRVIEYEALLNRYFPGSNSLAICQYNRERFSPSIIRDVLRTHPIAILGNHVCHNLYYEPPEFLLSGGNDEERVSWMIAQLKRNEEAFVERRRAEERLAELDRKKDEYLAILAHELRNPLAPIRNIAAILRSGSLGHSQIEWCRQVIDRQVEHMSRLLEDLLDLSRLSQRKLYLKKERTDLKQVVRQAVETSRSVIDENLHRLEVSMPQEPVPVEVDSARINQVIINLLDNAAKYTDRGGTICVEVRTESDSALISVGDSGIGIDPVHLPNLFEIFSQVESVMQRSRGGLGIGLAIVRGIVEMHGGTVEALSDGPGLGSKFTIRLPLLAYERFETISENENDENPLSGFRILIADDNRDGADSLALMMESMGGSVRTAYDGDEAIEGIIGFRPHVAFLDIGMPKKNGYDVARLVRERHDGKEVVLVAQTGWGQVEDKRQAVDAGFDHHLVKPLELQAVLDVFARIRTSAKKQ